MTRRPGVLIFIALIVWVTGCASTSDRPTESAADIERSERLVASGDHAARQGDLRAALVLYRDALDVVPSAALWHRIAAAQQELGNLDAAAHAFDEVIALDDTHATAHEALGLLQLKRQDTATARRLLTRALELHPARWRAHNGLGILADTEGNHLDAIAHYQAALDLQPHSPMLLNNIGYSHYLVGDLDQAEGYFLLALAYGSYPAAQLNLGLLHARKAQYDEAVRMLAQVLDLPTAYNDAAFVAMNNGDYGRAERMLREAIRQSPVHYPTAQKNLALVQLRQAESDRR
jgi:Flp pilus assembly protein TadD